MRLDPTAEHTVAITGASGFVMGGLLRLLARETRWHFRAIVHPDDFQPPAIGGADLSRITICPLDVTAADNSEWEKALGDVSGVVHGAAVSPCHISSEAAQIAQFVNVNVSGTLALCMAARRHAPDARTVQVSSVAVYGHPGSPTGPLDEDDRQEPADAYDITKYAAERLALRFATLKRQDLYAVRLTRIFGSGEKPTGSRQLMSLPRRLVDSWSRQEPFRLTDRSLSADTDMLPVESAADAIRCVLVGEPVERVFNIGSGGTVKVAAVTGLAQQMLPGLDVVVDDGPNAWDADPAFASGKDGVFRIERAVRELGWCPGDVEESLRSYFTRQLETRNQRPRRAET